MSHIELPWQEPVSNAARGKDGHLLLNSKGGDFFGGGGGGDFGPSSKGVPAKPAAPAASAQVAPAVAIAQTRFGNAKAISSKDFEAGSADR
jgi:hypothetical protein